MTSRSLRLAMLLMLVLGTGELAAQRQFPWQANLDSRSLDTLRSPGATSPNHRYRVTAWGTYSMWEDTVNSSVDPVWIYSFPAEEWAKPEWRIFDSYPVYVGDPRLLDAHGVRINGKPFPQLVLRGDHRYSMVIQGDGRPVTAMLVDWNFRGFEKRDAHDNNSGWIHFLVEELPLTEWEICAVDSSAFPQIRLSVKVLRDSVRVEDFADNLVLTENGERVNIDRIDCSERTSPVSVAMVFDRSGSMSEPFGNGTRMDYTQAAGQSFVDRLTSVDESAIYSFSLATTLDQDWTNDRALLKGAIDRLVPDGWTAMNDAVIRAVDDIAVRPSWRRKAIVVLSDGEDNRSVVRDISTVIRRARSAGVPVFVIGLLLDADDSLRALAAGTGGKYFSVRDPAAMDSVFSAIAEIVFEKGCCSIYYTSPDARRDGSWRGIQPTFVFGDDTVTANPTGYHAPSGSSSVTTAETSASIAGVTPNPILGTGTLHFALTRAVDVAIDIVDINGRVVRVVGARSYEPGDHQTPLLADGLAPGRYFVRVIVPGSTIVHPLVILP